MGGGKPPFMGLGRRNIRPGRVEQDEQPVEIAPKVEPVNTRRPRRSFKELPDANAKQQVPVNQPIPVVPPVPGSEKAKPLRDDSLLEAIIKLVGSIMSFKRK